MGGGAKVDKKTLKNAPFRKSRKRLRAFYMPLVIVMGECNYLRRKKQNRHLLSGILLVLLHILKKYNLRDNFVITPKPSQATATQPKSNPKQLGCEFDMKIGLHTPPPTHRTGTLSNFFSLRAIQGNINQCYLIQSS
jgi:hypothetical protein